MAAAWDWRAASARRDRTRIVDRYGLERHHAGLLPSIELPIVRGRNFDSTDRPSGEAVAVINEHMAGEVFGGADPIGQVLENGDFRPGNESSIRAIRIVGVARTRSIAGWVKRRATSSTSRLGSSRRASAFLRASSPALPASASSNGPCAMHCAASIATSRWCRCSHSSNTAMSVCCRSELPPRWPGDSASSRCSSLQSASTA